jgi:flagellar protein FlgJ
MNVIPIQAGAPGAVAHAAELTAPRISHAKPLSGAALRKAPPAEQRKEVAMQFEAILVRQLLGPTMASMLGKEGGAASNVYGDMLTDTFAQQLTRGGGFGLGGLLAKQLAPRGNPAAVNPADPSEESL